MRSMLPAISPFGAETADAVAGISIGADAAGRAELGALSPAISPGSAFPAGGALRMLPVSRPRSFSVGSELATTAGTSAAEAPRSAPPPASRCHGRGAKPAAAETRSTEAPYPYAIRSAANNPNAARMSPVATAAAPIRSTRAEIQRADFVRADRRRTSIPGAHRISRILNTRAPPADRRRARSPSIR